MIRLSALALLGALFMGACSGGDGRAQELEAWAIELCAVSAEYEADVFSRIEDARGVAAPGTGRAGVARYAEAVREAEAAGDTYVERVRAIALPPADVVEFHDAQVHTFEAFTESLSLFAGDMEEWLETGELAVLEQAYPSLLAREDERVDALWSPSASLPADAAAALDEIAECGTLN